MIALYNSEHDGKSIDSGSIKRLTGLAVNDWKRLTGFFEDNIAYQKVFSKKEIEIKRGACYPTFILQTIRSKTDDMLEIEIDLEQLVIRNVSIFLVEERQGKKLGTIAHVNQIIFATELGFRQIELQAYGGKDKSDNLFKGYLIWGKLGYTMKPKAQKRFLIEHEQKLQEVQSKTGLDSVTLLSLLEYDEDYWKTNGNDWAGEFDLTENSENRKILYKYITSRSVKEVDANAILR